MPENFKQVAEKLKNVSSVLVLLSPIPSPDVVSAGLALYGYLKRMEKNVVIVSADGNLNPRVSFLPGYDQIQRELNLSKGFVIDVSTKKTQAAELSYKKTRDKLSIYLKPKSGQFEESDVSFRTSKYPHDLIITVGVGNLAALGSLYEKYADLFFETPILNIDFRGSNQGFGQFNLVELTATSNSEIVFDLISEMDRGLVTQNIATTLLTGIIAETNSFQHSRTSPQAFLKASQLVGLGADQQDIVNKLFKSKSLGFLKLWGRVLARIKHEPENMIAHSGVNRMDIEKSGASQEDVMAVLKEMNLQLGFAKIHIFFREVSEDLTEVYMSAPAVLNLPDLFNEYSPENIQPQSTTFKVKASLQDTEQKVLDVIRKEASKLS